VPSAIALTLTAAPPGRIGATAIAPDRLAAMSNAEISAIPLWLSHGAMGEDHRPRRTIPLGQVFAVHGERAAVVRVAGDLRAVDGLGAEMAGGELTIEGDAGRDVGRKMRGGSIRVEGSVGDGVGIAMMGGAIWVAGDAGDGVGTSLPGASRGMTGGQIVVRGSVGRDAATAVRRGLIVVGGDAGDGVGQAMIAGTILVMGQAVGTVGEWNKRGSIITVGTTTVPATYRYACTYRPDFIRLLFTYLRPYDIGVTDDIATGRYARYCGDLSQLGKGELLTWVAA
jgi:formylmethanofuran dehydrogenase subunit C